MDRTALAVYIDLENLPAGVDFDRLMDMAASETASHVFALKAAYGSVAALPKRYRQQLVDHNFQLVNTPHIAQKKNRADLMISVNALDRFHLNNPPIDRYVFVTRDSDFSVIMDKLRSHGKEVWMIGPRADQAKRLLARCCNLLLSIEDFIPPPPPPPAPAYNVEKDRLVQQLFKESLRQIGPGGLPINISLLSMQMRKTQRGFELKRTRFKRFTDLVVFFQDAGVLRLGTNATGDMRIEHIDASKLDDEIVPDAVAKGSKIRHESEDAILPCDGKKPKVSRRKAKTADGPSLFTDNVG